MDDRIRIIIISLVYLIYSHIIHTITDKIGKGHYHDKARLYDVCHNYLPNYEKYEFFVLSGILLKPSHMLVILFELISFLIPIYFVRSIFIILTVLPKSSTCTYSNTAFINGGCYDKIFSGHTAFLFILTLLLNKYNIISLPTLILLNFINVAIILLTRTHYTVDIIISFLICYLMYTNNVRI